MTNWAGSTNFSRPLVWRTVGNVLFRALVIFIVLNLGYALLNPLAFLGRISLYNLLYPGRSRLPYGSDPKRSYNLTITQLEAMLASHEIHRASKMSDEYRVLILGDSSVWGFLLKPDQTLSARINASDYHTSSGRMVRAFNLGYPTMSVTKDLLLLEHGLRYQPDLILWFVTLESLPTWKQIDSPVTQRNPGPTRALIQRHNIQLDPQDERFLDLSFWDRTIIGQRKQLADLVRLQLYGAMWASTSVDHHIPETYNRLIVNLPADDTFQGFGPGELKADDLAFDVLAAGIEQAGDVPVLIVNEPIFISQGMNSDIRYNSYYPRWAYDEYRHMLAERCVVEGWEILDLWDMLSSGEFTGSAIHYSPAGVEQVASLIGVAILEHATRIP